jgi:predicted nuclease of predicted toxin-antitoxin system
MIDQIVAHELIKMSYNVVRVGELGLSKADDSEILKYAIQENRILITLDEHFGDWAILPLKEHPGVIRLKVHPKTTKNILEVLIPFLEKYSDRDFSNRLVIVSKKQKRWIKTF